MNAGGANLTGSTTILYRLNNLIWPEDISMKSVLMAAAFALGLFLATAPVVAHHAFAAEFDKDKPVTLIGKVTKVEWVNPHTWIHMDVAGKDGKVVTWRIEGGAPNALMRRGWNRNSIKVGEQITVDGFLAKDGSPTANGTQVKTADGRIFGAASSAQTN
jgi:hypothetical protein